MRLACKVLLTFCATLLCACIEVDDFGEFRDKMFPDSALYGTWEYVSPTNRKPIEGFPPRVMVVEAVAAQLRDDNRQQPNKTLRFGSCRFAVIGDWGLTRYEVKGDVVRFYYHDVEIVRKEQGKGLLPGLELNDSNNLHIAVLDDQAAESVLHLCEMNAWISEPVATYVRRKDVNN